MPQTYDDILNNYKYVLDFVCPNGSKDEITKARMFLGNMKFTADEMLHKISELSGGQKAKLIFLNMVLKNAMCLFWTNQQEISRHSHLPLYVKLL